MKQDCLQEILAVYKIIMEIICLKIYYYLMTNRFSISDAASVIDRFSGRFPAHVMRRLRTPDGVYRYLHVSPGVATTFGLDPAVLLAQESVTHDWIHPDDRGRFVAALELSARELSTLDEEVRVMLPDGTVRWVRSLGDPKRRADGSVLWEGVALDVTDRREAMETVARAMESARTAEASASSLSTTAFAAIASPLASLRNALFDAPPHLPDLATAREALLEIERALGIAHEAGSPSAAEEPPPLTVRQREIARLVAQGLSNRSIADVTGLTEGTVKLHVSAILKRLGLRNRTELAWQTLGGRK
jgi:PAS domain S-box-containing protein